MGPTSPPLQIRVFRPGDWDAVIALWQRCDLVVPWNDPVDEIERKCAIDPDGMLVGEIEAVDSGIAHIVASLMFGYDGHRGWLNYLAVAPEHQQCGYGRALVEDAEARLRDRGCPKVNLQIRRHNAEVSEFYRQLGFQIDDVISMGKRL